MRPRVKIRKLLPSDANAFIASAKASRELHRGWVSAPTSEAAFEAMLEGDRVSGNARFLVWTVADAGLVGMVNVSGIVLGSFCSAYLGYYAFADYAGRGLFREGFGAVLDHAFETLKLHRVEANIQPGNERSIALVDRCGFRREGFSRRYLKIGGRWRDHVRYALLVDEWRSGPPTST